MTFRQLIARAEAGYKKNDSDATLLNYVTDEDIPTQEIKGDLLALFVVVELYETFDPDADEEEQIDEANRVMDRARSDLHNVAKQFT